MALLPAVLVGTLALAPESGANGGTVRLARAAAGPYLVSVWTDPSPARVGFLDVSVAVMRPPKGEPVLDTRVRLHAARATAATPPVSVVLALGAGGNLLLHHGEVELPTEGPWHFSLEVDGPAGHGQVALDLEVGPSRLPEWVLAGAGLALLAAAATTWLLAKTRRARRGP